LFLPESFFHASYECLASDSPELSEHIAALKKMNSNIEPYSDDGGYEPFQNHSDIWFPLKVKSVISYASNAIINKEEINKNR